ncbi:hypothetical protein Pat9b_0834 [Pantoea sp. At-9b]|nr:hypothetical protein Pat9b_0834 [Pantoea sp. At-9b]
MMAGVDMDFCAAYLKLNRHRYPVIKEHRILSIQPAK